MTIGGIGGIPPTDFTVYFKVEYHANAKYENPLNSSEKIACIGQRLMYPIMLVFL